MRIWAFPSFYPVDRPGKRSHGIFAHRQFKGLVDNGAELYVVQPVLGYPPFPFYLLDKQWTQLQRNRYESVREFEGIKVYHPLISNLRPQRLFRQGTYHQRYVRSIVDFFTRQKIQLDPAKDIFYSQWLPDSYHVQEAAHMLGVKSAILLIGDDVLIWPHQSPVNIDIFKQTVSEADIRFSVARYLANESDKITGPLHFEIVRRGVNYDFFQPYPADRKLSIRKELGVPADKVMIFSVGSAIVRKGWLDLFDALKEIAQNNDGFVLVGAASGGPEFDLDTEAKKRGLDGHFINLHEVGPDRIKDVYNAADIFCLPSHWEGIANAVVEAMATGLPVLTTDVCGHPELITSGENGILVPPKRPDRIRDEMQKLMTDSALRQRLGENARSFIVNTWGNYKYNSAKLYNTLRNALGTPKE